jgi:hypothetical protein
MYQNKKLRLAYILMYIMWLLGLQVTSLLLIKYSMAGALIMAIISLITLGGLITSHCFYLKDPKIYKITSLVSFGLYTAILLIGLIIEIVLSASSQSATYAWVFLIITLIVTLFGDFYLYKHLFVKEED